MKKTFALFALSISAIAAAPAFAQSAYVGGAIGMSNSDINCAGTISCDKNTTGGKVYGGYKFNSMFAAELGYLNLGKFKGTTSGGFDQSIKSDGYTVGVAAFVPIANQFSGVVRGGLFEAKATGEASAAGLSTSSSDSSTNGYLGLGLAYDVNKQVAIDAGVDFTKVKFNGESTNVALWSIGARYAF